MRTYKLYATAAASADAIVSVLIARSGRIKSVRWAVGFDMAADNSAMYLELSTRSTNQLVTTDSQGDIATVRQFGGILTSGAFVSTIKHQEMLDFPIAAGERIYLHATIVTCTFTLSCYIDCAE